MKRKKQLLIIFIFLYFIKSGFSQITFQKTYGGNNNDFSSFVQQTPDGGFIVVGQGINTGLNPIDIYLVKTDNIGDTIWTKTYGGPGNDYGNSVKQTADGGYIVEGSYGNSGSYSDIFLIKTDSNGNAMWTKTYGGANGAVGNEVNQTTDGGYIIGGSLGIATNDVYLLKTDNNGDTLWSKTFGGPSNDGGSSVKQTTDGGYIITGYTQSFGAGSNDVYLIKVDSVGDLLWSKTYGTTQQDIGHSVQQTADGGYIITAETHVFGSDIYLIKTDINGDTLWTKTYGGMGYDFGYQVQQTNDGGYIIAGWTESFGAGGSDIYLIKTDANGILLWTKTFGGTNSEEAFSVQQAFDGGYIITGHTQSFGSGGADIYLIKTDSIGNSGCNEGNTTTMVISHAPQVTNPLTIINSPATIVTTPAIIVGGGGIVSTPCTVSINELITNNSLLFSPNPSPGNFEINFSEIINKGTVEIYNVLGKRIFSENVSNESKKEINLKNISSGIYFVKVFVGEKSYCKKLIVEHD